MIHSKSFGSGAARLVLGAAASCLLAGAALAEQSIVTAPADQTHVTLHQQVRYGDLDLASEAGRLKLDRRLRFAASDVCDQQNAMSTHTPYAYLGCYKVALNDARTQVSQRTASSSAVTVAAP